MWSPAFPHGLLRIGGIAMPKEKMECFPRGAQGKDWIIRTRLTPRDDILAFKMRATGQLEHLFDFELDARLTGEALEAFWSEILMFSGVCGQEKVGWKVNVNY